VRFIRRKKDEQAALRCPTCQERLPEDATVCHMCGELIEPSLQERSAEGEPVGQQQSAAP